MSSPSAKLTMLTFAPMIDSECTRRLLGFAGAAHEERDRLFGWVSLLTLFHGGYGRVPLVYGGGARVSGSLATAKWLDSQNSNHRLVPTEQPLGRQVMADFALYNGTLARDVAAFAYFHLLPERDLMIETFGKPVTSIGRRALPLAYGPIGWLFRILLRLSDGHAADAWLRINAVLDWTDSRVTNRQSYLHGDLPTLADFALMSAMAPIVVPKAYASNLPPMQRLPDVYREAVRSVRMRPTGEFVLRLYDKLT